MKIKSILSALAFIIVFLPGMAQKKSDFKVVGYYSMRSAMTDFKSNINELPADC